MDPELLSRVQFALTASFHFIFPPLSMGLGLMLLVVSGAYLRTKDPKWRQLAFFWTKIYGLIFALGVATGVVQEFEFGMNWADYSRFVGNVFGSLLAAEGVFAFALEGGFLGLMLFGGNRLGPKLWFFASFMVVFGAHFSALWIVMANSWMQTPQGFEIAQTPAPARAVMTDFWQVLFTPSFFPRLMHVFFASWTAGAALMMSVSAFYILKKRHMDLAMANMKVALAGFIVFACANFFLAGPQMAIEVTNNQPLKLASMEGLWQSTSCAPLYLAGWVDTATQTTTGISIPCLLSVLAYLNPQAVVQGIDSFAPDPTPPINLLFQVYHFMFAMGSLFVPVGPAGRGAVPLEAAAVHDALVALAAGRDRLLRRGRDHRGLVDRGDRPPAVGRLQRARDRRRRLAEPRDIRGGLHDRRVRVHVRDPARGLPVPAQQPYPRGARTPRRGRDRGHGVIAEHLPRGVPSTRSCRCERRARTDGG